MIQAIKNIIPRLVKFSKQIDKMENFVDKTWIYIDHVGNNHEYYFMRDYRLIMSLNGTAITGKWELLPDGKLLIDRVTDKIILKNQFIDDALMILQKSSSEDDPFILVDEKKIPDLDVLRYLHELEEEKIPNEKPLEPGTVEIQRSGRVRFKDIEIGYKVKHHEGLIVSGTYFLGLNNVNRCMVVQNGIITDLYYLESYIDDRDQEYKIRQKEQHLTTSSIVSNLDEIVIEYGKEIHLRHKKHQTVEYYVTIDEYGEIKFINNDSINKAAIVAIIILFLTLLATILINR